MCDGYLLKQLVDVEKQLTEAVSMEGWGREAAARTEALRFALASLRHDKRLLMGSLLKSLIFLVACIVGMTAVRNRYFYGATTFAGGAIGVIQAWYGASTHEIRARVDAARSMVPMAEKLVA
jgi:hypothetical protein